MGFGILLIGYFLIYNIPYFGMTDLIAAAVMAMGLNKLSPIGRYFKLGYYVSLIFTVFSIPELIFYSLDLFDIYKNSSIISYLRVGQSVIVCTLTVLILKGIYEVAKEVDLERVPKKAERLIYFTFFVYTLWIICSTPYVESQLKGYVAYVYLAAILLLLLLVTLNLSVIYACYMRICMPEDNKPSPPKSPKMSERDAAREERRRTDEEYRAKKAKEKQMKKDRQNK